MTESNFTHFNNDNYTKKENMDRKELIPSNRAVSNKTTNRNCSYRQSAKTFPKDEIEIGLLFASKAIVQVCTNPIIGSVINR